MQWLLPDGRIVLGVTVVYLEECAKVTELTILLYGADRILRRADANHSHQIRIFQAAHPGGFPDEFFPENKRGRGIINRMQYLYP